MTLSHEQIELICNLIGKSGIYTSTLKDDVLDHLCCIVEDKMDSGKNFEESMNEALAELAPGGLDRIQHETDFLVNSKNLNMKKLVYLLGLLSTMAMSFGLLLRILRMQELGNAVFAFGCLGLVALFLPLLTVNYFKDNATKSWPDKLRFALGTLSGILVGIAFLFKIMHMPGAD